MTRAKELKLCFKCLCMGRQSQRCDRQLKCFYCKYRNRTALCRQLQSGTAARQDGQVGRKASRSSIRYAPRFKRINVNATVEEVTVNTRSDEVALC